MSQGFILSEKKTMAHAKMLWQICDIIGIPVAIYGFIINIDNIKSSVIALLVICYLLVRLYFYVIQKKQAVREKELELWHKLMDKEERKKKMEQE